MYQAPLLQNNQANMLGNSPFASKKEKARSAGPIMEYKYDSLKPKKQLKEIKAILRPQKKKALFIKYGHAFDVKNRCVVCGTHHVWEADDPMRPYIPLSEVDKGRPMKGTYCPKHTQMWRQMEMLEQQIIADKHGLDFKRFIPKARIPMVNKPKEPITTLTPNDVAHLTAEGWTVEAPEHDKESNAERFVRLKAEIIGKMEQLERTLNNGDEQ